MCLKPWFNTKTKKTTPCGGCIGCRMDRMRLWTERTKSEARKGRNAFVTLTYDEEHLRYKDNQIQPSLDKEQMRKWLDNIRHQIKNMKLPEGCRKNYAYYVIGEYGGKFKRPHYHAIILGLDYKDCEKLFKKLWKNGMIKSEPVEQGSIRYVLDYSMKNINGKMAMEMYDNQGIERPFCLVSKGYGKDYIQEHRDEINRTGYIQSGQRKIIVPTYYKNLYLKYDEESIRSREEERLKIHQKAQEKANSENATIQESTRRERQARQEAYKEKLRRQNKPYELEYYNEWETTCQEILSMENVI